MVGVIKGHIPRADSKDNHMDPKWVRVIAIVVVVGVVAAGVGGYFYFSSKASSSACNLHGGSTITVDQAEAAETADPQVAFSTPGWGIVQQLYQTLVMYNGTSYTTFSGELAKNWSTSADRFHWNFTLWPTARFSNGDSINAYVEWYSLYRLLALQGIDQYLLSENFWYPGVNYYSGTTANQAAVTALINQLNSFNFENPTASELAVMEAGNQSFQVINPNTIELNLGNGYIGAVPYTYLLAEMATPGAATVDPVAINANGGISGTTNAWMTTHAAGSGPYNLSAFSVSGYTLSPNGNYWGSSLATQEPWNNNIQPARDSIQVIYQGDPAINIQDLKSGTVAASSFAYLGPASIQQLMGLPCITVTNFGAQEPVFSGAGGSWWMYMNQSQFPFSNILVREAIVHAINYSQIITDVFGGYAFQWVGPVPPGHPYYNPGNVAPYPYNLTLARQEMKAAGFSGQPGGVPHVYNYAYLTTGPSWEQMAVLLQNDLAQIGIAINPVPITLQTFYIEQTIDPSTGQCTTSTNQNGGPFPLGQDFYSSDYISPDDWTQQNVLSYGSANICNSGYHNASMDALVLQAAGDNNPANLTADYSLMTQTLYQNYTDAWLIVPVLFNAYNQNLQGIFPTPMGSTVLSSMQYNTMYVS